MWRSLAKVLCRVLCRLLSRLLSRLVGEVWQRCSAGCWLLWGCSGGEVSQQCCAGCCWEPEVPRLGSIGSNIWEPLPSLGSIGSNVREPLVPRTGNPRFQDWEALVRTFEKRQCPELGTYAPMTSNSWEWQFYKAIFFSSFDDAYFFVFGCRASIRERCKRSKGETLSSRQIGKKKCRASEHMSHVFWTNTDFFGNIYVATHWNLECDLETARRKKKQGISRKWCPVFFFPVLSVRGVLVMEILECVATEMLII